MAVSAAQIHNTTYQIMESIDDIMEQHRLNVEQSLQKKAMARMQKDHEERMAAEPSDPEEARQNELLAIGINKLEVAIKKCLREVEQKRERINDLSDERLFSHHARFLLEIANDIVLAGQNRTFVVDENNNRELRFLLYYFNNCPLCETVFPGRGYKMHKHIMLQGQTGCGKTVLMQVFSEYLRLTDNPNYFHNLSVTQMVNYYTLHNNLDRYTYNEESGKGFKCQPVNICLNDIGVQTTTFYGKDTNVLTNEFLHARNEIWTNYHMTAHLTTNLTNEQLKERYRDGFGRLIDRFKTYNIIPLGGGSRR